MKLKNIKLGMKVVVKKQDHYHLNKDEVVEVIDVDLLNEDWDDWTVQVEDCKGNHYWLNHKDVKKLKEV